MKSLLWILTLSGTPLFGTPAAPSPNTKQTDREDYVLRWTFSTRHRARAVHTRSNRLRRLVWRPPRCERAHPPEFVRNSFLPQPLTRVITDLILNDYHRKPVMIASSWYFIDFKSFPFRVRVFFLFRPDRSKRRTSSSRRYKQALDDNNYNVFKVVNSHSGIDPCAISNYILSTTYATRKHWIHLWAYTRTPNTAWTVGLSFKGIRMKSNAHYVRQ